VFASGRRSSTEIELRRALEAVAVAVATVAAGPARRANRVAAPHRDGKTPPAGSCSSPIRSTQSTSHA